MLQLQHARKRCALISEAFTSIAASTMHRELGSLKDLKAKPLVAALRDFARKRPSSFFDWCP